MVGTKKRMGLIYAREYRNLSKKQVADATGIEYQRYKRIESDTHVRVDVEEAYRIAAFLGNEHPKEIFLPDSVDKINSQKAG